MTYRTKRALRDEINNLKDRIAGAERTLKDAGYGVRIYQTAGRAEYFWGKTFAAQTEEADRQAGARTKAMQAARDAGVREALELVIDALELRDYDTVSYTYKHGVAVDTTYASAADRFKADLEATLNLRIEKAAADKAAATAARISALANRPAFATGGLVSNGFDLLSGPVSADRITSSFAAARTFPNPAFPGEMKKPAGKKKNSTKAKEAKK